MAKDQATKKSGLQPGGYIALGVLAAMIGVALLSDGSAFGFVLCLAGVALVLIGVIAIGVRLGGRD